jgi:Flp pilus assembly protein TadD
MLVWLYTYGKSVQSLEKAFHYVDQSLALEPRNQGALLHRARILDKMGLTDLARHAYDELLFLNRHHPEARRKVKEYETRGC